MEWFQGEVSEAVKLVKQESKVLLVFIKGTDDESGFVASQFDEQVSRSCCNLICLQLDASSHATAQFSAVYAVLTVPCIYLINPDGQVIDVKLGRIDNKDLIDWIRSSDRRSIEVASIQTSNDPSKAVTPAVPPSSSSPGFIHTEANHVTTSDTVEPQAPLSSGQALDERVDYARKLIEAQRREKEEEYRKKSIDAEIKRRETGKALHEFKERQRQKEIDEAMAERRKEEAESRAQLEKLRQQIEEDRKAREERWQRVNGLQPPSTENTISVDPELPRSSCDSNEVRLQLRSLEGGHLVHQFPATASLAGDVRNWIQEMASCNFQTVDNLQVLNEPAISIFRNLIKKGYRFLQLHPKRLLEPEEECQSLRELGYCPSATLFLVSDRPNQAVSLSSGGIASQFYCIITSGVSSVYGLLSWAFSGIYSLGHGLVSTVTGSRTQQSNSNSNRLPVNPDNAPRSHSVRRQGNIARLSHMPDNSDDEQARWNGNSTEQL
uniref:UBX domain-containing protein 4 n=1 Tax=Trichobilharzia regenti TaxID=157069 RepID=A0AA85JH46_TRIRE|nr:unnamed protein product [Trichobilharzia regenti]